MTKSHLWHVCVSAIVASLTATSVSPYLSCGEHYQKGVTTCNLHLCEVGNRSERSVRVRSHQATEPRAKEPRATKTHRHLACNLFSTQQSRPPKTPTGLALVISDGGGRPSRITCFSVEPSRHLGERITPDLSAGNCLTDERCGMCVLSHCDERHTFGVAFPHCFG